MADCGLERGDDIHWTSVPRHGVHPFQEPVCSNCGLNEIVARGLCGECVVATAGPCCTCGEGYYGAHDAACALRGTRVVFAASERCASCGRYVSDAIHDFAAEGHHRFVTEQTAPPVPAPTPAEERCAECGFPTPCGMEDFPAHQRRAERDELATLRARNAFLEGYRQESEGIVKELRAEVRRLTEENERLRRG